VLLAFRAAAATHPGPPLQPAAAHLPLAASRPPLRYVYAAATTAIVAALIYIGGSSSGGTANSIMFW